MNKTITLEEYAKKRSRRIELFKKYSITVLFLLPFITAFIVFFVCPLFYGTYISFMDFDYDAIGQETFNDFEWYRILFDKSYWPDFYESFWLSFKHTIVFAVIMIPVAIVLPLSLAILINSKPPGFKLFRALIYMPSIVPLTTAGSIFAMIFMPKQANGLFYTLTGIDINWFGGVWFSFDLFGTTYDVAWAWIPIFLMCLWGGWGGNFIILSAGLQNVPKHLYEAADIDGCSAWKKILNVTIPGIKPQLVLCIFTTIIGYLGLYGQNFVLVDGGPAIPELTQAPAGGLTSTIMYFIQDIVANNLDFKAQYYGLGAAASIVFAAFIGVVTGIQMYMTRDKKTGTKISEAFSKWQQVR